MSNIQCYKLPIHFEMYESVCLLRLTLILTGYHSHGVFAQSVWALILTSASLHSQVYSPTLQTFASLSYSIHHCTLHHFGNP